MVPLGPLLVGLRPHYGVKWTLFAVTAVFMMAVIGVNIRLAYRLRPTNRRRRAAAGAGGVPDGDRPAPQGAGLGRSRPDRAHLGPDRRGQLADLAAVRQPDLVRRQGPAVPHGHVVLHLRLPVHPDGAVSFLFAAILLSLVAAAVVHYLYGGLRLQVRGRARDPGRPGAPFVLVGIFVLLKAVAYWVDRYGIDFSQRGVVQTGASYTDVNAVLPAKTVLAVIAVICAALFFAGAIRRNSLLPPSGSACSCSRPSSSAGCTRPSCSSSWSSPTSWPRSARTSPARSTTPASRTASTTCR